MRPRSLGLSFVAAALAIAAVSALAASQFSHGRHSARIHVDRTVVDLGSIETGGVAWGEVSIRNDGKAPLEFSASRDCISKPLAIKPSSGVIAAGRSATLRIALRLECDCATEREFPFVISNNDVTKRIVDCKALVRCVPPDKISRPTPDSQFEFVPTDIRIVGAIGEVVTESVVLRSRDRAVFLVERVGCDDEAITVSVLDPSESRSHTLEVQQRVQKAGLHYARVNVSIRIQGNLKSVPLLASCYGESIAP